MAEQLWLKGLEPKEETRSEYQQACNMVIKCRRAYPDGYETMDEITKKEYDKASNIVFNHLKKTDSFIAFITSRPMPRPQHTRV